MKERRDENLPNFEVKQETAIDRITGIAGGRSLRSQERVPPGIIFALNMSLRIFAGDVEAQLKQWVETAITDLQDDALGGSGTRGYGWVKIDYQWVS